jgi:signal recognition particle GTPase
LNALGQNSNVELYERGYGKDAAGIAKDAINYGMYKIDYGGDLLLTYFYIFSQNKQI